MIAIKSHRSNSVLCAVQGASEVTVEVIILVQLLQDGICMLVFLNMTAGLLSKHCTVSFELCFTFVAF